jgi:hypothetical protein
MEKKIICEKCKDTGRILKSDGTISLCFDCLLAGRLDQHAKDPKDSGIKI